jgi:hypothetical protein
VSFYNDDIKTHVRGLSYGECLEVEIRIAKRIMNMQCEEFEQTLEQEEFEALPKQALAHLATCAACTALFADFGVIHSMASELAADPVAPLSENVWIALRNQLEAEGLIRDPQTTLPSAPQTNPAWWSFFQRPAMAGAFLALVIAAAGTVSYLSHSQSSTAQSELTPVLEISSVPTANNVFKEEVLNVNDDAILGVQRQDSAVTASIRRNLQIVDNFIAMCEKDVREQPDNQIAREYLYGAYQQKAELLATAMNRNMTGGLQ